MLFKQIQHHIDEENIQMERILHGKASGHPENHYTVGKR